MATSALSVPRVNASFPGPTIDRTIAEAVRKLDYSRAIDDQANAIREFVAGRDIFVTLSTGRGKSLCYAALPFVLTAQSESRGSSLPTLVYMYKHQFFSPFFLLRYSHEVASNY